MFKTFGVLAKLKMLRGTPFNIFGYSAERRMEVSLIKEYESHMNTIKDHQTTDAGFIRVAEQLLKLPDSIRGFGPVKEASVQKAAEEVVLLLTEIKGRSQENKMADGKVA